LLLWVHCGEVASCADIAQRSRLPFSAADLDAFVDEQRASADLIGLDRATAPASMAELGVYYEEIRPGGPLSDMAATAGLRATRLALSQERLFLGAMRAIHRAESAADER
jgi:uncharacterized protein (DUF2236 family)